jgi:hypothetical protein
MSRWNWRSIAAISGSVAAMGDVGRFRRYPLQSRSQLLLIGRRHGDGNLSASSFRASGDRFTVGGGTRTSLGRVLISALAACDVVGN